MAKRKKPVTAKAVPDVAPLHDLEGRLETEEGEPFTVEVWVVGDTPKWTVSLIGWSDQGDQVRVAIGRDEPHLKKVVPAQPNGNYALSITATLQAPGARFTLNASSESDEERVDLVPIADKPVRMDALPVRVG